MKKIFVAIIIFLSFSISAQALTGYAYCPDDNNSTIILKGYLSLGYDDKDMHLEGIFQSGDKVIKLSIIEILYFIYKEKDAAETFVQAYEESLNG